MIGAILTTAAFALVSSTIATIGNFAMARDFPDYEPGHHSDILLDSPIVVRFMQYRLMTNIFYNQSRVLWTLSGVLLAYELLTGF